MDRKSPNFTPELWGGIECTINRVKDFYLDQLNYAGHYNRTGDIELLASLGIKTLRYPILWEKHQEFEGQEPDWSWTDKQLASLKANSIVPIVGLLHHGSGPSYTDLLDPRFPELMAEYASKVAQRYPYLKYYTPVNEPLTTARFSGLYGFWYPHKQNDICFVRMLLNQVKAIILCMEAIRKINPDAQLVQTEDLGKTYSSPSLQYQANFENERRWLTYDLLSGRVKEHSAMWKYFMRLGLKQDELEFFVDNQCPPDIMGFNHYITSERYLDENIKKHPTYTYGGNEIQEYADVEAVRVASCKRNGLKGLLEEAWKRYRIPIAITEAQLNCTREEQLRWLKEIWDTAVLLNKEGVYIHAVTCWSLFGAFGWNELLTSKKMEYEPGAFDLSSGSPKPTALCHMINKLATTGMYEHALLSEKGWWHRDVRHNPIINKSQKLMEYPGRPVLIIGKRGTLGSAFARVCSYRAIPYFLAGREDTDITKPNEIQALIKKLQPWAIINTAGWVKVDEAEQNIDQCYSSNTIGPYLLAQACKKEGIKFMTFSSDLVFDGSKRHAYDENDVPNPINIYGRSKAIAETLVAQGNEQSLIIRTSAFFGPWDKYNFVHAVLDTLGSGKQFLAADDICISPTYIPDLVNTSLDQLIDDKIGICHISNLGEITWSQLAIKVALKANLNTDLIIPTAKKLFNYPAPRPNYTVLKSVHGLVLPSLDNALSRFFHESDKPYKKMEVYSEIKVVH